MTTAIEIDIDFDTDEMAEKYSSVGVSIMRITPDLAKAMLERNRNNRPIGITHLNHLKGMFNGGEMLMNGETIIFGVDGSLLNGQHRLTACELTGVPFDAMVVCGIDLDAFKTMDVVKPRNAADTLRMSGIGSSHQVSSAVQALVSFVDNGGVVMHGGGSRGRKVTPTLCQRVLEAHPGLIASVRSMNHCRLYRTQHSFMLHYLFSIVDRRLGELFSQVLTSSDTDTGRPFVRLRESLIASPLRTENRRQYAAKAIKAFNAERLGMRPKMFKFIDSEEFPTISGLDYDRLAESI